MRPDSESRPEHFHGVTSRRIIAYLIDLLFLAAIGLGVWIVFGLLTLLTLGILSILFALTPLVPFLYHTMTVGGRGATPGMKMMGLRVVTDRGQRPDYFLAAIHTLLFYATLALTGVLLIVALFNREGRCLHDMVTGLYVVRDMPPQQL